MIVFLLCSNSGQHPYQSLLCQTIMQRSVAVFSASERGVALDSKSNFNHEAILDFPCMNIAAMLAAL